MQDMAAQSYATDYNTTMAVATAWMGVQDRSVDLDEAVRASSSGAGYAGFWYDNAARKVVVNLKTSTSPTGAQTALSNSGVANDSRIEYVPYTDNEYQQKKIAFENSLVDLADNGKILTMRGDQAHAIRVMVGTSATASDRSRITAAITAASPVPVQVTDGDVPTFEPALKAGCKFRTDVPAVLTAGVKRNVSGCPAPVRGAQAIASYRNGTNLFCTSAFTAASRSTGLPYLLTAGHCLEADTDRAWNAFRRTGTTVPREIGKERSRFFADSGSGQPDGGDVGVITIDRSPESANGTGFPKPWIAARNGASSSFNSTYEIRRVGISQEGRRVCLTGTQTGTRCGDVLATGSRVRYGPSFGLMDVCPGANDPSKAPPEGESGAPIWKAHEARGIFSSTVTATGRGACIGIYMSAEIAEDQANVNILTRR